MSTFKVPDPQEPLAWRAADLEDHTLWRRRFGADEIDEIDAALEHVRSGNADLDLARLSAEQFPLPEFSRQIRTLQEQLQRIGVRVFEGFPVERYDLAELRAIFWGLALHVGTPVVQSRRNDLLGDVRDLGTGISGRAGRGYTSNQELNFHSDAADVAGLFFLQTARSGGVSGIASALAMHDAIAERRPDLLEVLYQPLYWSYQSNEPPGSPPYYRMPVFGRGDDGVACAYVRTNLLLAERNAGAPPMSEAQREAVEYLAAVAREPGMYVEALFDPGTMLFTNNHIVLHRRTAFVDWDQPERKRHLLRVWLSPPNSGQLPESFASFFGDVRAGATRGGYPGHPGPPCFETG
jgi:hypothetical protein